MKLVVIDMGVDFRSCNAFMPENLLQGSNIRMPILVHKGCCRVTKFMRGQTFWGDARSYDMLLYNVLNGSRSETLMIPRNEQRVGICIHGLANRKPFRYGLCDCRCHIYFPFFIALSNNSQYIAINLLNIEGG